MKEYGYKSAKSFKRACKKKGGAGGSLSSFNNTRVRKKNILSKLGQNDSKMPSMLALLQMSILKKLGGLGN